VTIAVAVRTSSALVFAADSKLTTNALAGVNPDGTPRWVDQTYDNATKVVHDKAARLMAMVAGDALIGELAATDYISMREFPFSNDEAEQEVHVKNLLDQMMDAKRAFWSQTKVPPAQWPGPTLVLATHCPGQAEPKLWRASLRGDSCDITFPLVTPGVLLEGAYAEVFSLLYGWRDDFMVDLTAVLNMTQDQMIEAFGKLKTLRPVEQINCMSMPVQDAMDLAALLCSIQVEMDRFMPGLPACGGPIDLMVLRTVPSTEILVYPGKELHHPVPRR
jgi:hypothetical protein